MKTVERHNVITGIAYFWDSKENGNSHYLDDYMGGYGAFSPVDPCTEGIYEPPVFKKINGHEEVVKAKIFILGSFPLPEDLWYRELKGGILSSETGIVVS